MWGSVGGALRPAGDRDGLPVWQWRSAEDWADIEAKTGEFIRAGGEHGIVEERRLAYVAFTPGPLRDAPQRPGLGWPRHAAGHLTVPPRGRRGSRTGRGTPVLDRHAGPGRARVRPEPPRRRGAAGLLPQAPRRTEDLARAAEAVRRATDSQSGQAPTQAHQGVLPLPGEEPPLHEEMALLLAERARLRERREEVSPSRGTCPRPRSCRWPRTRRPSHPRCAGRCRRRPRWRLAAGPPSTPGWSSTTPSGHVDILDLPGSADEDPGEDAELPAMKERFLASEWAHRTPAEIEIAVETVIDGMAVRAGSTRSSAAPKAATRSSTGRPAAGRAGRWRARARSSSRHTAWPSPGFGASSSVRSTRRSTTREPVRRSGPSFRTRLTSRRSSGPSRTERSAPGVGALGEAGLGAGLQVGGESGLELGTGIRASDGLGGVGRPSSACPSRGTQIQRSQTQGAGLGSRTPLVARQQSRRHGSWAHSSAPPDAASAWFAVA